MIYKFAVVALALAQTAHSQFQAVILADANRDGRVDASDFADKGVWTDGRGALLLANIVDTNKRCSNLIKDDTPDMDVDKCNDASDNVLRNPNYLAPLRTLPIGGLSNNAIGTVFVTDPNVSRLVRIFRKVPGGQWTFIPGDFKFTRQELSSGMQFGVDARDVRRPQPGWDGRVNIRFTVTDGSTTSADEVAMRVAPLLIHHHLQEAEQLFIMGANQSDKAATKFVSDVINVARKARMSTQPMVLPVDPDRWTQDFFEPGYMSIPGPFGKPIVIRINIRAPQVTRFAGRYVFTHLRSGNVGGVQFLTDGGSQDSGGNVEAIPPYEYNGKKYPAGRVIQGRQIAKPLYTSWFLAAQETQEPVELDTSWLLVGHVDEFIQFLPANTPRGWVVAVDDPMGGLDIFQELKQAGLGLGRWLSRPFLDITINIKRDKQDEINGKGTIQELLSLPNLTAFNVYCSQKIEKNLDILKRETGITEDEIIRVPGIYYEFVKVTPGPGDEGQANAPGAPSSSGQVYDIIGAAEGIFNAAASAASGGVFGGAGASGNGGSFPFGGGFPFPSGSIPFPAGGNPFNMANGILGAAGDIFNAAAGVATGAAAGVLSGASSQHHKRLQRRQSPPPGSSPIPPGPAPLGTPTDAPPPPPPPPPPPEGQAPQQGAVRLLSATPAVINGVVLSNKNYLSANPWGPIINGRDIFQEKAREIYGRVNMVVHFVDDWFTLHVYQGEVHCGTNVARRADAKWW